MKALVTGAAGFSGRHLVAFLRSRGDDVVAAGHDAETEIELTESREVERLCREVQPDVIFHLAGTSHISAMRANPMAGHLNVIKPAVTLLDAMLHEAKKARLILVSTCQVYGRPHRLPTPEDHPLAPVDTYGSARAAVEHVLKSYLPHGLDVVIARPYNQLGPGLDRRFAIPDWIAQQAEGPDPSGGIVRVGNLDVRRDYCDVRDVVAGYALLADRGERGQAYNLCSGQTVSMRAMFERACPGATASVDEARVRRNEPAIQWGDPSRAEALGWARRHPIEATTDALRAAASPGSDPV